MNKFCDLRSSKKLDFSLTAETSRMKLSSKKGEAQTDVATLIDLGQSTKMKISISTPLLFVQDLFLSFSSWVSYLLSRTQFFAYFQQNSHR